MPHNKPQSLEQLADQVIDRLNADSDCPSCAASILVEALAKVCTEAQLDPNAIISRFAAEVWAHPGRVRCDCDDCKLDLN